MTSCTVLLILALGVIWDGKTDLLMFGLDRTEIRSPQNRAGFVSVPASTHLFEAETDCHPPLTNTTNEAVEIRKRSGSVLGCVDADSATNCLEWRIYVKRSISYGRFQHAGLHAPPPKSPCRSCLPSACPSLKPRRPRLFNRTLTARFVRKLA